MPNLNNCIDAIVCRETAATTLAAQLPACLLVRELTWRRPLRIVRAVSLAALDLLFLWQHRSIDRHRLVQMDIRTLKDIGISPAQACFEADKPFWRA